MHHQQCLKFCLSLRHVAFSLSDVASAINIFLKIICLEYMHLHFGRENVGECGLAVLTMKITTSYLADQLGFHFLFKIFSRIATCFHRQANVFEVNFFIRKTPL